MKKILIFVMCIVIGALSLGLASCVNNAEKGKIVIAAPDGAPVLAVYELLKNVTELDGHPVEYKILAGAQNIGTSVISGEVDIAVMPTNVAAKLYNNGTDIKLLSVNIFGVLYMVGKNPLENGLNDLIGKVVLNIGRGGSPDITTRMILDNAKIPYEESEKPVEGKVALRYVTDASEVIAMLKQGVADYGVMGEPAVTNAVKAIGGVIACDLQSLWNDVLGEDSFLQAGVVVNKRVYSDNGLIEALYAKLESNLTYIYSDCENVKGVLMENGSALKVDFTAATLNRCNLKNVRAKAVKAKLENYYNAVIAYDKTFVGGKLPDEGFYY